MGWPLGLLDTPTQSPNLRPQILNTLSPKPEGLWSLRVRTWGLIVEHCDRAGGGVEADTTGPGRDLQRGRVP